MTVIGALSSFRELGEMSPHKRACVHEWSSSWLVAQPEAIRLGVTSVNSLLSHAPPFSTVRTSLLQSNNLAHDPQCLSRIPGVRRTQFVPGLCR